MRNPKIVSPTNTSSPVPRHAANRPVETEVAHQEIAKKKTSNKSKMMHKQPLSSGDTTEKSEPVDTCRYSLRSSSRKKTEGNSKAGKKDDSPEDNESEETFSKKRANKDSGIKTVKKSKAVQKANVKTPIKSNEMSSTSNNGDNASGAMEEYAKDQGQSSGQDLSLQIIVAPDVSNAKAEPTYEMMRDELFRICETEFITRLPLPKIAELLGDSFGQDLRHRMSDILKVANEVLESHQKDQAKFNRNPSRSKLQVKPKISSS